MNKRPLNTKKCFGCEKVFTFYAFKTEAPYRLYCTRECSNKFTAEKNSISKRGERNPAYRTGLYSVNEKGGSIRIILDRERECHVCGRKGIIATHKGSLIVHHLDEDRTNNKLNNLMVLCRKCHWAIHNKNGK